MQIKAKFNGNYNFGRIFVWIISIAALIWFVIKVYKTFLIFLIAFLIAFFLEPFVKNMSSLKNPLTRKNISRISSVSIVFSVLIFIIFLITLITVPIITQQVNNLITLLPAHITLLQDKAVAISREGMDRIPYSIREQLPGFYQQIVAKTGVLLENMLKSFGKFFLGFFSTLFMLIMAIIIAFFMLLNWEDMKKRSFELVPEKYRDEIRGLNQEMHNIFGNFIKGMILICIYTALINFILLFIFGLFGKMFQYNLTISVLNGLTSMIPYFGIIITFVIAFILGYIQAQSFTYAIIIALLALLANKIVDQIVYPKVMSDTVCISPLLVIFAAFSGGELFGLWGMIIAVPLAAMLKSIISFIYKWFLNPQNETN